MAETLLSPSNVLLFGRVVEDLQIVHNGGGGGGGDGGGGGGGGGGAGAGVQHVVANADRHGPFVEERMGQPSELEGQIVADQRQFARIYGFSFEGFYYDLPRPVMFLVHGDGAAATQARPGLGVAPHPARAPGEPSLTGLGQADFEFSDDIRVWSYDKADYTIRMDVETGMFEDVLLAAMLGGPGGFDASGMNARGMNARGMNARGMNARGMNARGMNARGGGNSD